MRRSSSMRRSNSRIVEPEGSDHLQLQAMWVVSVADVLQICGPPTVHEELRAAGKVVPHRPGMYTVFVSHQWLGLQHPDPEGAQFQVLQQALRGCIEGTLPGQADLVTQFYLGDRRLSPQERSALAQGHVWMDWFSIPQVRGRTKDRRSSVRSIHGPSTQTFGLQKALRLRVLAGAGLVQGTSS